MKEVSTMCKMIGCFKLFLFFYFFFNSFIDHYTYYIQQTKQPERNEKKSDSVKRAGANEMRGPMRGTSHDTNNN